MEPLLNTLAREYSRRYKDLKNICFLFPNKRCGIFLKKYFAENGVHTDDLPHLLTISEFVSQISKKIEADRIIQLFSLYKTYIEILGKESGDETTVPFDTFKSWGETVISDFNTVDLNLGNVNEIFKNVKDYRELTSNFLTEDQKEVMLEYFGVEPGDEGERFWKNFENPGDKEGLKNKFLNLWQILAPLHDKFIERLEKEGLGTTIGNIYRKAAEKIKEKGNDVLPYKKIVAVGFNALTESERVIFKTLQDSSTAPDSENFIDFIWDSEGPVLESEEFTASRFVDYNKKHFPSPKWYTQKIEERKDKLQAHIPDIRIIAAPSNTSQTKVAGEILKDYVSNEGKEKIRNSEVALILPDESLLSNMIYSIPDGIEAVNLTMGISLRHSSIAGFMSLWRRLYMSMREKDGERIFFVKDLRFLFSHPITYQLFKGEEIDALINHLNSNHFVTIKNSEIEAFVPSSVEILSFPSKTKKGIEILSHIDNVLSVLMEKIKESPNIPLEEVSYIKIYKEYLDKLGKAVTKFEIESQPLSLFSMVNKLIAGEKVGFEGEPLYGLQVMGTLETRCLDFKEVIILSMNEGIMPRKTYSSSFIPDSLRKFYGLPPSRYAEEIFGYYFYRLLSRANKVTLIYDGRTISGMRGGESRYLLQLKNYLPKDLIKSESWQYRLQNRKKDIAPIIKTFEIKNIIGRYSSDLQDKKNLSSSALNTYRECEVKFFLQNLLNINSEPESGEYPDSITIGNVLHEVMQKLYVPVKYHGKLLSEPLTIDKKFIDNLLLNSQKIRKLIDESIQKYFYKDPEGKKEKINSGVVELISGQIEELINIILNYDRGLAPFRLYGCEIKQKLKVKLSYGREVNFNFAIDRLDEIELDGEKRLRIVDYKTGSLKLKAKDLEDVFSGGYKNEQIFQLFVYAWLLGKIGVEGWEDVMTEIYYLPALSNGERSLPKFDKTEVFSFSPYKDEFGERLEEMIESIFIDPEFKFPATTQMCEYCGFKNFCMK